MEASDLLEAGSDDYLRDLFSALANRDSLRIFRFASEGIPATKGALEQYQFSKKRYYVRLKHLVDLGLVTKQDGAYRHTPFGSIIYENQVKTLSLILAKGNTLELLKKMKQKNKPNESLNAVISDLSRQVLRDLETSVGLSNFKPIRLFKFIDEYDKYVTAKASRARSEVYFTSRKFDPLMAESLQRMAQRGRQVDVLYNVGDPSQKREVVSDSVGRKRFLRALQELQTNPSASVRRGKIPLGFLVVDNLEVAIEITNSDDPQYFLAGLGLQSELLASRLVSLYEEISKHSRELPLSSKIDQDEIDSS
jgi:hypothetical protein